MATQYRVVMGREYTRWKDDRREAQLAGVARGWGSSEDQEAGWLTGKRPNGVGQPRIYLDPMATIETREVE